jgi:hypothetical protein
MAYSLDFSSGGIVNFPATALFGNWVWEIEVEVPNTTNQRIVNFNNNSFRYLRADSGFWELRNNLAGLPDVVSSTAVRVNTRTVIRLEASAGEVSWFIDGTPQGVVGTQTNDFILNNLNNSSTFTGKVYRHVVSENGTTTHEWIKNSLVGNPDTTFNDNVGTSDGTLSGFPDSNDHWSFFSTGEVVEPAIPIDSRKTFKELREYLVTQGFDGSMNKVIYDWLVSEGYSGQFNQAFYNYLETEGYTGSLSEKLFKWKQS